MITVQKIARAAMQAFHADGITLQQFNQPAGGQTVFHTHVHILPRFNDVPLTPHNGQMEENEILTEMANVYKGVLSNKN